MLTLDLVDRLLASTLVPHDAKLAAVESWRRELAAIRDKHHYEGQLERRLAEASRMLAAARPRATRGELFAGVLASRAGAGARPMAL
jgi:hypothetical protein